MTQPFILSPRYRLDDESAWLKGIDPLRNYWLMINGNSQFEVQISGLTVSSIEQLQETILQFRCLQPQQSLEFEHFHGYSLIHCLSANCYALETTIAGAPVWHLFDQESLESLLMTSHPDWQCAPQHLNLGRKLIAHAFAQPAAA